MFEYTRPAPTAPRKPPIEQSDCVVPPPRRSEYGRMKTDISLIGSAATFS